ncbi:uncharacterized protein EI97DRAFT_226677 [Westerdykella ornata]|uniref:Zn(2)-C6 fungal-type domain-containing protein n=1 Tax=Westerdykella ornata TaxID=318751 RepID=A0A6A6JS37_WESOR|nr:uncharacterized protein EI97DRAFT_226677 [Westerdykella ornata]KAF2279075.1 hypothetical protein EI97DRAFT_226677 [Westerdykella ornata]
MSTPGAEDASPSPEYSGDQDGSDMAEERAEAQADDAEQSRKATTGQKPSAANAKDPFRPRRKKARRACLACQRAHLTCSDERPCGRCIDRGLSDTCVDGVRKKAKYLHDAPDAALQPPQLRGNYPQLNGNPPNGLPVHDLGNVSLQRQTGFFNQPSPTSFYARNPSQAPGPVSAQDASPVGQFSNAPPPISPPFNQNQQTPVANIPSTVSQGAPNAMQQFGGPLFDPSDPALFNFDISSLNFGNHYGAMEMGMLGHMSSGVADVVGDKNIMTAMNQAGMYNQQMPFGDAVMGAAVAYDGNSIEWQNAQSRHGSIQQIQTPNNTPISANLDHMAHRHDSLHGHAFAIGQGPASLSSASPASTDVNAAYETDNTMAGTNFYQNPGQHQVHQPSARASRMPQQENRGPGTALQPLHPNVIRKRRRDTKWIYEGIKEPYDYVGAFHRLRALIERRYPKSSVEKIRKSMAKYRPALITQAGGLQREDLIYQEIALQLSLSQIDESFSEVGVPSVVCRRSGEVVWMNKEFSILTGWERDVLLGRQPNLNVNTGVMGDPNSTVTTGTTTTPVIAPSSNGQGGNYPVLIVELMDERSAVEYLDDFAEAAFMNSRGTPRRRVNFLRYMTKEEVVRSEQDAQTGTTNRKHNLKSDSPLIKLDGGAVPQGETAMSRLSKNGLVDCMIQWHVKRDNFDMPMLVCMHVMPVLDSQPVRSFADR